MALGISYDTVKYRPINKLSGGQEKRLDLEYLLRGAEELLLLDELDNFLDVLGKIWLENQIRDSSKTFLYITHDRQLLANTVTWIVTVELGSLGIWCGLIRVVLPAILMRARIIFALGRITETLEEQHIKLRAQVLYV